MRLAVITECFHGNGTINLTGEYLLKYQTGKLLKMANHLSSDFLFLSSFSISLASMITALLYIDLNTKKWHKSLGTALTSYCDLSTRTILQ